jgi:hypothetical protein
MLADQPRQADLLGQRQHRHQPGIPIRFGSSNATSTAATA